MAKIRKSTQIQFDEKIKSTTEFEVDGDLNINTHKLTNVVKGTADTDGVNVKQLNDKVTDLNIGLYQLKSEKNQTNGYAGLGADGKISATQLPSIAITDTFVVASEAAMLALTAETGDIAIRTDINDTYILKGSDPTLLADWAVLQKPTATTYSYQQIIPPTTSVTGLVNGTNKIYTVEGVMNMQGEPVVYLNGITQIETTDYSYSYVSETLTITFVNAPKATGGLTDVVTVSYIVRNIV